MSNIATTAVRHEKDMARDFVAARDQPAATFSFELFDRVSGERHGVGRCLAAECRSV